MWPCIPTRHIGQSRVTIHLVSEAFAHADGKTSYWTCASCHLLVPLSAVKCTISARPRVPSTLPLRTVTTVTDVIAWRSHTVLVGGCGLTVVVGAVGSAAGSRVGAVACASLDEPGGACAAMSRDKCLLKHTDKNAVSSTRASAVASARPLRAACRQREAPLFDDAPTCTHFSAY